MFYAVNTLFLLIGTDRGNLASSAMLAPSNTCGKVTQKCVKSTHPHAYSRAALPTIPTDARRRNCIEPRPDATGIPVTGAPALGNPVGGPSSATWSSSLQAVAPSLLGALAADAQCPLLVRTKAGGKFRTAASPCLDPR